MLSFHHHNLELSKFQDDVQKQPKNCISSVSSLFCRKSDLEMSLDFCGVISIILEGTVKGGFNTTEDNMLTML